MTLERVNLRTAFVVAHPAHLLTVCGMLIRWRPHVLILNRTSQGPGAGQVELVQRGLQMLGVGDRTTCLDIDEPESYRCALAGDYGFHTRPIPKMVDWLVRVQPDRVLGDAFEMSNFQHDIGCVQLHAALGLYEQAQATNVPHYEFPLSCRESYAGAPLKFGVFVGTPGETFELSAEEIALKRQLVEWAAIHDPFIADVAPKFETHAGIERLRRVPNDRDYARPVPGLALHYDQRGRQEVANGRYSTAISFEKHFVPIAREILRWVDASLSNAGRAA